MGDRGMCCWNKDINISVLLEGGGVSELEDRLRMAGIRIKTVLRVGSLMRRESRFIAAETGNILVVLCLGRGVGKV
jgi:hypothetical protein